jgi:L-iditol 2-dehydrogenase
MMKAVVLESPESLTYAELPRPLPAAGEALVQVAAVSICGSDLLRVFAAQAKTYPLILGHEFAGTVVEVGSGVEPALIGKRIMVAPLIPCMDCPACSRGFFSACQRYSFIGSRRHGGFAEYCAVPVANLVPLPDEMDFECGAVVEPATVALHALLRGGVKPGDSVGVLGAGSVGQYVVQWARIKDAALIVATDALDGNLVLAKRFGAHLAINARTSDVAKETLSSAPNGLDVIFEVAGLPETLMQAVQLARPRGTIVCVGNQTPGGTLPTRLIEQIVRKELDLKGTWMSYSAPFPGVEWTEAAAAAQSGTLELRSMISHRIPLSELTQVFAQLKNHSLAHRKIVIFP